jgi:hypothetical protein
MVNIGTYGQASTGGNCNNFIVNIGTDGTYTNYQNACPSEVNIGTYGVYNNNVSGCSPLVNIGAGAIYNNINNVQAQSSTTVASTTTHYTTTYTTSSQTTTISQSTSGSCNNFELTEYSADASVKGSCTWSGGYLTITENEGIFQGINVSIGGGNAGSNTSINVPVYDYPSCQTIQHYDYLPAGIYNIYVVSGSSGISCQNSYAYVKLSS